MSLDGTASSDAYLDEAFLESVIKTFSQARERDGEPTLKLKEPAGAPSVVEA